MRRRMRGRGALQLHGAQICWKVATWTNTGGEGLRALDVDILIMAVAKGSREDTRRTCFVVVTNWWRACVREHSSVAGGAFCRCASATDIWRACVSHTTRICRLATYLMRPLCTGRFNTRQLNLILPRGACVFRNPIASCLRAVSSLHRRPAFLTLFCPCRASMRYVALCSHQAMILASRSTKER